MFLKILTTKYKNYSYIYIGKLDRNNFRIYCLRNTEVISEKKRWVN